MPYDDVSIFATMDAVSFAPVSSLIFRDGMMLEPPFTCCRRFSYTRTLGHVYDVDIDMPYASMLLMFISLSPAMPMFISYARCHFRRRQMPFAARCH